MRFWIAYILISLFVVVGGVALTKSKRLSPVVIVSQSAIHPTNCIDNDPLMPVCTIAHLVVENRGYRAVTATILCGEDEAEVNLSPRIRLIVDIEENLYVPDMKCEIKHWEVK